MFPFLGVSMAPSDITTEYVPFHLTSVSPETLRAPQWQRPSLYSQPLLSTGLSVTVSSFVLLPKLQIYIYPTAYELPHWVHLACSK